MSVEGKTVLRIDERPTDLEFGYERDDTVLIRFTDGTALEVVGSSHEEVSLSWSERSAADVHRFERAAIGRREEARLKRLQDEAWMALPCEARAAKRNAERADQHFLVPPGFADELMTSMMMDVNRRGLFGGSEHAVSLPCEQCGERRCPNAQKVLPSQWRSRGPSFVAGTISIPVVTQEQP